MKDYYGILGVSRNASVDEIKSAFRNLARQYHPDVSKEENAEAKFKEINEAYETLSDDEKRAKKYPEYKAILENQQRVKEAEVRRKAYAIEIAVKRKERTVENAKSKIETAQSAFREGRISKEKLDSIIKANESILLQNGYFGEDAPASFSEITKDFRSKSLDQIQIDHYLESIRKNEELFRKGLLDEKSKDQLIAESKEALKAHGYEFPAMPVGEDVSSKRDVQDHNGKMMRLGARAQLIYDEAMRNGSISEYNRNLLDRISQRMEDLNTAEITRGGVPIDNPIGAYVNNFISMGIPIIPDPVEDQGQEIKVTEVPQEGDVASGFGESTATN